MEPIYTQSFLIDNSHVDRFTHLKTSQLLSFIQEVSGRHSDILGLTWDGLAEKHMFWAVVRHRVQITRMPSLGETITLETWPCPTTRVAFPRSVIGRDEHGDELFRSITLWVLMNLDTRAMILPGSSGVEVMGHLRGLELDTPASLHPAKLSSTASRKVCYSDLDRNGHMNNSSYVSWVDDLLPSAFHQQRPLQELVVCYLSEAREGQVLEMEYDLDENGCLRTDMYRKREGSDKPERIFASRAIYG